MDLTEALVDGFHDVVAAAELADAVPQLIGVLRTAIPSFLGLELELAPVRNGPAVTLAVFEAGDDRPLLTSLRLTLPRADRGTAWVTFYAAAAGALVDLAADLRHTLRLADPDLALDQHLSPVRASGLHGLTAVAAVAQATGVLIQSGYEPGDAGRELAAAAGRNQMAVADYASLVVAGRLRQA